MLKIFGHLVTYMLYSSFSQVFISSGYLCFIFHNIKSTYDGIKLSMTERCEV